jgi:hypothetical protein
MQPFYNNKLNCPRVFLEAYDASQTWLKEVQIKNLAEKHSN